MELRQLLQFLAIVEAGSLTKAAPIIGVTPQGMSQNLAKLEKSLGAQLFERGAGGSSLTKAGLALLAHARSITSEADRAMQAVHMAENDQSGTLYLGIGEAITNWYVHSAIAAVQEKLPNVRVMLEEATSEIMLSRLSEGEFDLVLGAMPSDFPHAQNLTMHYLFETWDRVVARKDHPLAGRSSLKVRDLVGFPWLMSAKRNAEYGTICSAFVVAGEPVPTDIIWADSASVGLSLILAGDYLTLSTAGVFPELYSAEMLTVLEVDQPTRARRSLLCHRKDYPLTPAASIFMKYIIKVAKEHRPDLTGFFVPARS